MASNWELFKRNLAPIDHKTLSSAGTPTSVLPEDTFTFYWTECVIPLLSSHQAFGKMSTFELVSSCPNLSQKMRLSSRRTLVGVLPEDTVLRESPNCTLYTVPLLTNVLNKGYQNSTIKGTFAQNKDTTLPSKEQKGLLDFKIPFKGQKRT